MKPEKWGNLLCKIALSLLCGCVLFAAGCAARANRMIPAKFDIKNKHPYTVNVQGHVPGPNSLISDEALTEALTESILKSGVFKGIVKGEGADYRLSVVVLQCDQPWVGLDFDIKVETAWTLTKLNNPQPVWAGTVPTRYKATLSKALIAEERRQKAIEGALSLNIQKGIEHLSTLQF